MIPRWLVRLVAGRELEWLNRAFEVQWERAEAARQELKRLKADHRARIITLDARCRLWKAEAERYDEYRKEIERLRALNGKTYSDYCRALAERDRLANRLLGVNR